MLVPIPWQPNLFLHPQTLALLQAVAARLGYNPHLVNGAGAWRPYAEQKRLYDGWVKRLPGFNLASNPDTGQRSHMRGAAFDLQSTHPNVQAACRAVGLVRDPVEPWHWNDPRWASMPIIKTNTSTAGTTGTAIPIDLKGKTMDYIFNWDDKVWWLGNLAEGYLFYIGTNEEWKGIAFLQYGPSKDYTRKQFQAYAAEVERRKAEIKAERGTVAPVIDYGLLAAEVAKILPATVAFPYTLEQLAKAVNDDQAARLAN